MDIDEILDYEASEGEGDGTTPDDDGEHLQYHVESTSLKDVTDEDIGDACSIIWGASRYRDGALMDPAADAKYVVDVVTKYCADCTPAIYGMRSPSKTHSAPLLLLPITIPNCGYSKRDRRNTMQHFIDCIVVGCGSVISVHVSDPNAGVDPSGRTIMEWLLARVASECFDDVWAATARAEESQGAAQAAKRIRSAPAASVSTGPSASRGGPLITFVDPGSSSAAAITAAAPSAATPGSNSAAAITAAALSAAARPIPTQPVAHLAGRGRGGRGNFSNRAEVAPRGGRVYIGPPRPAEWDSHNSAAMYRAQVPTQAWDSRTSSDNGWNSGSNQMPSAAAQRTQQQQFSLTAAHRITGSIYQPEGCPYKVQHPVTNCDLKRWHGLPAAPGKALWESGVEHDALQSYTGIDTLRDGLQIGNSPVKETLTPQERGLAILIDCCVPVHTQSAAAAQLALTVTCHSLEATCRSFVSCHDSVLNHLVADEKTEDLLSEVFAFMHCSGGIIRILRSVWPILRYHNRAAGTIDVNRMLVCAALQYKFFCLVPPVASGLVTPYGRQTVSPELMCSFINLMSLPAIMIRSYVMTTQFAHTQQAPSSARIQLAAVLRNCLDPYPAAGQFLPYPNIFCPGNDPFMPATVPWTVAQRLPVQDPSAWQPALRASYPI
jgi:hypothetical protein